MFFNRIINVHRAGSALVLLYGTTNTMEHHHFNHAVMILSSEVRTTYSWNGKLLFWHNLFCFVLYVASFLYFISEFPVITLA